MIAAKRGTPVLSPAGYFAEGIQIVTGLTMTESALALHSKLAGQPVVHVLGASQTSFFFVLVPVFGTLLAAIFLDERVSAVQGAGIAAVAVGMMLATFRRRD
jgi:threonine/homoserine efflux transporter RhtA